ncbi:hypothetical protein [Novosphingobium sp. BL-8A]|uniref:hypothetical protein n=1 Tax=Novosphingobium sp. BL-8A TaxID=3127639 RepID=UPI0037584840
MRNGGYFPSLPRGEGLCGGDPERQGLWCFRLVSVADLVKAIGARSLSKSQVSRLVAETDEREHRFDRAPFRVEWPYHGPRPPISKSARADGPFRWRR